MNDHLTSYFNGLYLIARIAKKEGKLASASSYGGKIRARKSVNDAPSIIYTEKQLKELIESNKNSNQSINTSQLSSDCMDTNTSTQNAPTQNSAQNKTNKRKSQPSHKGIKTQDKQKRTEKREERATGAHKAKQRQSYDQNRGIQLNTATTDTGIPIKKARTELETSAPVHIR